MRVVLAPSTEDSERVLGLLVSWSAAGLLKPFCWWSLGGESGHGLRAVSDGAAITQSLKEALQAADEDTAQLVAFSVLPADTEGHDGFVEDVLGAIAAAKDVIAPSSEHPFEPTMVVVPESPHQRVNPDLFRAQWAANVYVAPEDRHGPASPSALTESPRGLTPHAAHALATLGDLWLTSGEIDPVLPTLSQGDYGSQTIPVHVARCYTRAVDFGYFAGQLAARVFQPTDGWPNPDFDRFDRTSDGRMIVDHVLPLYWNKHEAVIGLSQFTPIPVPGPRELGILEAIRELFRTWTTWLLNRPYELFNWAKNTAHDRAATAVMKLGGPNSGWTIKLWGDRQISVEDILAERAAVPRKLRAEDGPTHYAWTDLWTTALGLIDGASLPDQIDGPELTHDGKRYILTLPNAIVPDPSPPREPTEEDPDPRVCDPRAATTDGGSAVRPDGRPTGVSAVGRSFVWQVGAKIADALKEAEIEGAAIDEREAEKQRAAAAEEHAKQAKIERKQVRRRFLRALLLRTILAVGITIVAWLKLPLLIERLAATVLCGAAWWVAFGLLAIGLIRHREASELAPVQRAIEALNATLKRALRAGDRDRLERRYLEYLDWAEIIGWMAHHPWVGEPLQRVALPAAIDPAQLPAALAFGIPADGDQLERVALELNMSGTRGPHTRRIFNPGWLTGLYQAIEHQLTDRADGRPANPTPAADKDDDPGSPRRQLLRGVRAGAGRHLSSNPLAKELLHYVDELDIDQLAAGVAPMGEASDGGSDALPPSTAWLNPPSDLPALAARLRPLVVRIDVAKLTGNVGGSGVVVAADGLIATARHVIDQAERITVRFPDGAELPATEYRVAPHTDLALIAVENHPCDPAATLAGAGDIEQGDPVISLGHPHLMEGESSLAWGLITAARRRIQIDGPPAGVSQFDVIQATYQSAGGASGAPVFDLDGRLVGIHTAGSGPSRATDSRATQVPEHIRSAIPISELHTLLAGKEPSESAVTLAKSRLNSGWQTPGGRALPSPSAFMRVDGENAFPSQYWADLSSDPHTTFRTLASGGASQRVGDLAGACSFYGPIRVTRSIVQLAASTAAAALFACEESAEPTDEPDLGIHEEPSEVGE